MDESRESPVAAAGDGRRRWGAPLKVVLKVLVTVLLFAWIARSTNLAALTAAVRRLDAGVVAAALLLIGGQQLMLAWRWQRIVRWLGHEWPFMQSLRWVLVGLIFNQALPTTVGGDGMRIWALHRHGVPTQVALGSVVLERGSGLALMALMIAAAVLVAPRSLGGPGVESALLGSSLLLLVAMAAVLFADKWLTRWLPQRVAEMGARFGSAVRSLFGSPRALAELTAGGCAATGLGFWAIVVAGHGLGLAFEASVFVALVGGALLLSLLPISLGGWGLREAGMVALFAPLGAPAEPVLALSVLWGALPLVIAVPGAALFWLFHRGEPSLAALDRSDPCSNS